MPWPKPDLSVQLGQLLWLHRCAFESELAGQFEQASLFWHTFYRRLTRLARQSVALAQLFDQLAAAAVPAGDDDLVAPGLLLRAFVDEVLIDTHCAIYNGWARQGLLGEKSRAFAQTAYLRQLLDIASRFTILSPAEVASYQASLMQPQLAAQIAAHVPAAALMRPELAHAPADAPILTTKAGIWQRHVIGPRIWLRSPADGLLKAALAVTLLLICVVGGLTLFERHTSAIRDSAYADIRQAVARGDDHAVLVQAELFFANRPIGRPDRRSQLVRTLYSQSFVDWFGTSYADQPADFQERVDRYAALADH